MSYTARSVIFDFADSWGSSYWGLRSIEFYKADVLVAFAIGDVITYGNELNATLYSTENAFDQTKSKTGTYNTTGWFGANNSLPERLIIDFTENVDFDEIRICNAHNLGTDTVAGVKNTKIYYSTDAISDITYDASIANSTLIFDGQIAKHSAVDEADEHTLTLIAPAVAKVPIRFKSPKRIIPLGVFRKKVYTIPGIRFGMFENPSGVTEVLEDAKLDLSAYLEFKEDSKLDLSAYLEFKEDSKLDLSLAGDVFEDLKTSLQIAGWDKTDNKLDLSAYLEFKEDSKLDLSLVEYSLSDIGLDLNFALQFIESFGLDLVMAKEISINCALDLSIGSGSILVDCSLDVSITDGVQNDDMGMSLAIVGSHPVFKAIYAINLTSVVKEII